MKLINYSENIGKGSAILWDEAGVDISNRNWQSTANKMLNYLLQTFRHRNFILLFTAPYLDFVDSSTRKLFHAELKTIRIDYKKETCKLAPRHLQYNDKLKKYYRKRMAILVNGKIIKIGFWNVKKPDQKLINAYETKKDIFGKNLNADIERELLNLHGKRYDFAYGSKLTERQEEVLNLLKSGMNQIQIAKELEVHQTLISKSMKSIVRKGYKIDPVRNKTGHIKKYKVKVMISNKIEN